MPFQKVKKLADLEAVQHRKMRNIGEGYSVQPSTEETAMRQLMDEAGNPVDKESLKREKMKDQLFASNK